MSNLQIFKFHNNQFRVEFDKSNQPWFCLVDVCKILGIANSADARTRLESKDIGTVEVITNTGKRALYFIAEPNLYRLIFQSRKVEAAKFQTWVFEEVLPQIRKTGSYGQPTLPVPEGYPRYVTGWELDGLHDFIHEVAYDHFKHYSADVENAIIMRIKFELGVDTFERKTTIKESLFDKAFSITREILYKAEKLSDQAQRWEKDFIECTIKGMKFKM